MPASSARRRLRTSRAIGGSDEAPARPALKQYDRRHPSKYGVTLKGITEAQLRSGTPVLKLIPQANGFKRTIGSFPAM